MNVITNEMDDASHEGFNNPGAKLACLRQQKGYSLDYAAGKLHLRVRVIEQLEADDYQNLPEAVFVQGYLRAYAKLLGECPEKYVAAYKKNFSGGSSEGRLEKIMLWQGKREAHRGEKAMRWFTGIVAFGVLAAVCVLWFTGQGKTISLHKKETTDERLTQSKSEKKLTELSKMKSLFLAPAELSILEK